MEVDRMGDIEVYAIVPIRNGLTGSDGVPDCYNVGVRMGANEETLDAVIRKVRSICEPGVTLVIERPREKPEIFWGYLRE
jgi:hypothetical protein